ncbi:MAG: alpha/beta fold hydrolase, partial [Halopseudomonas sp.]
KLPGHGGTPDPEDFDQPTLDTELALIEQIVAATSDQPLHLVAHSYGGVVALALAIKGNLKLSRITLFEPVATWTVRTFNDQPSIDAVNQFYQGYRRAVLDNETDACSRVIDFWCNAPVYSTLPEFIHDAMRPLTRNNLRHWELCQSIQYSQADLQDLTMPLRVAHGDRSHPVAAAIARHLCAHTPNSREVVIAGADHFLVTSHVDQCLALIRE